MGFSLRRFYPQSLGSDLDGDGLGDLEELRLIDRDGEDGLSVIDEVDSVGDFDRDGVSNGEELSEGTDPVDSGSGGLVADADGDGLPDEWEVEHFGDATGALPLVDVDGDGVTNEEEYLALTDPWDRGDYFRVEAIEQRGEDVVVSLEAKAGRIYVLEMSEDLRGFALLGVWEEGEDGPLELVIPDEVLENAKRQYRLRVEVPLP